MYKSTNGCQNTIMEDPDVLFTHYDSICITSLKTISPPSQKVAYWFSGSDFQGWRQEEAMAAWG